MSQYHKYRATAFHHLLWILPALVLVAAFGAAEEYSQTALFEWPGFFVHAHSHNDYQQKRPFLDAVNARLSSVEADLWFEDGKVLVAHDRGKWRGDFESTYLKPLNELWLKNALAVREGETFLLWLDLKDGSAELCEDLHRLLESYPVTRNVESGRARVQVVLTGHKASKEAFVAGYPSAVVTRDSNSFQENDPPGSPEWSWYALDWKKLGTWDGRGDMPAEERDRLRELVGKIHAKQRKVRLWNHPATMAFWREASDAGVDRLGTDRLPVGAGSAR